MKNSLYQDAWLRIYCNKAIKQIDWLSATTNCFNTEKKTKILEYQPEFYRDLVDNFCWHYLDLCFQSSILISKHILPWKRRGAPREILQVSLKNIIFASSPKLEDFCRFSHETLLQSATI